MSKSLDEIQNDSRDIIGALKINLKNALTQGTAAIKNVISAIERSGLPRADIDALIKEAITAIEKVIEEEKKEILEARSVGARMGLKDIELSEWDQYANKVLNEFPDLNKEIMHNLEVNKKLDKAELKNLKAGKGISEDYIKAKKNQLENEVPLWDKLAEAERVINLKRQISESRKRQVEEQAKSETISIHEEQKDLLTPREERKKQLKSEWDKHSADIKEAESILSEIDERYAQKEKEVKRFNKIVELSKAQDIAPEYLDILQRKQEMDNKILSNRQANLQTLSGTHNILPKQTPPTLRIENVSELDLHLPSKIVKTPKEISETQPATLKNPETSRKEDSIKKAKEIKAGLEPSQFIKNHTVNKESKLQIYNTPPATKIKPREL